MHPISLEYFFEASKHLQFKEVKIVDKEEIIKEETYNMNFFIIDEIRDSDYGKKMILYFRTKDESCFIIRDLLSFIVHKRCANVKIKHL
ncbi:hypothetical protein [Marinisporobacter balticus]|uniref:Uncharacterized protein n=1 Tax=Marinisporobacter balticus TaxID=2018667 RepID=A0A4R2KDG1_9FIRM|nr:hypothetical protein [Marinisporobacter balticus]TCO67918.1 hypothetical protein EV214_15110 [Marinisporobacter balticus]